MPITNRSRYGFRYIRAISALSPPTPLMMHIATGYANRIRIGDPVKRVADGSIEIAAEGDTDIWGVVTGGGYYWDGSNVIPALRVPGATAWGTVWERRSRLLVTPAAGVLWEIDVDDNTTATTEATYAALEGSNADHNIANTGDNDATPTLDISTAAATTFGWRIIETAKTLDNEDLAGANVKLWVTINESGQAPYTTTGI